jgi:hypothetical protein
MERMWPKLHVFLRGEHRAEERIGVGRRCVLWVNSSWKRCCLKSKMGAWISSKKG